MATPIQHLNVIVDPLGSFLLAAADPFDTGTNPVAVPDPSSNNAAGGSSDPGNPLVRNPGRQIRPGGSGVQPNRHIGAGAPVPPSPPGPPPPPPPPPPPGTIRFVQDAVDRVSLFSPDSEATDSVTFDGNVTVGNLIVLTVCYYGGIAPEGGGGEVPVVTNVNDSFGTVYVSAGPPGVVQNPTGNDPLVVWLYYGIAATTGYCTISYTITKPTVPALGPRGIVGCEYSGVSRGSPLAGVAADGGSFEQTDSFSLTPGAVAAGNQTRLVVMSVFYLTAVDGSTESATADGPYPAHLRVQTIGHIIPTPDVADFFPVAGAPGSVTPSLRVDCHGLATGFTIDWAAIAASFNRG